MKKVLILALILFVCSGCNSAIRRAVFKAVFNRGTDTVTSIPPGQITRLINQVGESSKKAGEAYINGQISNRQSVSKSELIVFISDFIVAQIESEGIEVTQNILEEEVIPKASEIANDLWSENYDSREF